MNQLQMFFSTEPLPADATWAPVIAGEAISNSSAGALVGVTVGSLVMEPLLHPGEMSAVHDAIATAQDARTQLAEDQQKLQNVEDAVGKENQATVSLQAKVDTDKQTVATAQHQVKVTPSHNADLALEGAGVGVAAGLLVAGVKLAIRRYRTNRQAA